MFVYNSQTICNSFPSFQPEVINVRTRGNSGKPTGGRNVGSRNKTPNKDALKMKISELEEKLQDAVQQLEVSKGESH